MAVSWALVACFEGAPATGTTHAPLIGGAVDDAHPAVVALRLPKGGLCSGAVVAPRVVLTAGHCVRGLEPKDVVVVTGPDANAAISTVTVTRIGRYPMATGTEADFSGGVDLAAVETATPLAAPPFALAPELAVASLKGRDATVVGYGRVQAFEAGSAGVRGVVTAPLSDVCARTVRFGDDVKNTCYGDSGGAVLIDNALFAIVSAGRDGCNTPSTLTRLDAHELWLASIVEGRFDDACSGCVGPDAACNAPVERATAAPTASSSPPPGEPAEAVGGGGCALAAGRGAPMMSAVAVWIGAVVSRRRLRCAAAIATRRRRT